MITTSIQVFRKLTLTGLLVACLFTPGPAEALTGQVNINTATVQELEQLPYIGTTRARAILKYRRTHGPIKSPDELLDSKTIGKSTMEAISPYLTLSGPTTLRHDSEATGANAGSGLEVNTRIFATRPGELLLLPDQDYYETVLHYLGQAKKRIDLAMFLFKITDSPTNRAAGILQELVAARRRGVEIFVLLEHSDYDQGINRENRRVARILRKNQIQVAFDTPATTTHTKLMVIDGRYSFVGSHNLTHSALAFNHEFSLLIDNRQLAKELRAYLTGLATGS